MLLAIDIAMLLPAEIAAWAIELSAALPPEQSQGLRLDDRHLPHVTLAQAFVDSGSIEAMVSAIGAVAAGTGALTLAVTSSARSQSSVSLAIERNAALQALHEHVMAALSPFEMSDGDAPAFFGGEARPRDVAWVTNFRAESSFDRYWPHVTLGHAERPPDIEPRSFAARTLAACHLGRFCSCRQVLRDWTLS